MIPILFDSLNDDAKTNGKGKLTDIISCTVHEELNGDYSAEFEYPITGTLFDQIQPGLSIQCIVPRYDKTEGVVIDNQWFDIYKIETPIDGVVKVYCTHASRRLSGRVYMLSAIAAEHPEYLTNNSYWTPGGDLFGIYARDLFVPWTSGLSYLTKPKSVLAAMIGDSESLVSVFGGDFAFYTALGTGSYPRTLWCDWVQRRGADKGAFVRYGRNMTEYQSALDYSDTYGMVCPYWDDGNGNRTYTLLKAVLPSPQPTTPVFREYCLPLDCSNAFATQPTSAQLEAYAQTWLTNNTPWIPADTLEVDFVNIDDEHSADIALGDTVHIFWDDIGVSVPMRCVAYDWDVLEQKYATLTLGKQQTQFVAVTGGGGFAGAGNATTEKPWRYVGTATGATTVTLPSDNWTEIYVSAFFGPNPTVQFSDIVPRYAISDTEGYVHLHGSFSSASDYHAATIQIKRSTAGLGFWNYNGSSVLASSYVKVWVR